MIPSWKPNQKKKKKQLKKVLIDSPSLKKFRYLGHVLILQQHGLSLFLFFSFKHIYLSIFLIYTYNPNSFGWRKLVGWMVGWLDGWMVGGTHRILWRFTVHSLNIFRYNMNTTYIYIYIYRLTWPNGVVYAEEEESSVVWHHFHKFYRPQCNWLQIPEKN